MRKPRNPQDIVQLEDKKWYRMPNGDLVEVHARRDRPPQRYTKLLDEGVTLLLRACNREPSNMMLFFSLAKAMNTNNILCISLEEIAESVGVSYHRASMKMSALCAANMICRTGTVSKWMINPHVVTKCSEEESAKLQSAWYEQLDANEERATKRTKKAKEEQTKEE